jgi:hypothetical protein
MSPGHHHEDARSERQRRTPELLQRTHDIVDGRHRDDTPVHGLVDTEFTHVREAGHHHVAFCVLIRGIAHFSLGRETIQQVGLHDEIGKGGHRAGLGISGDENPTVVVHEIDVLVADHPSVEVGDDLRDDVEIHFDEKDSDHDEVRFVRDRRQERQPWARVQVEHIRDEHLTLASGACRGEAGVQGRIEGKDILAFFVLLPGAGNDDPVAVDDVDVVQVRGLLGDLRQILDDGIEVVALQHMRLR